MTITAIGNFHVDVVPGAVELDGSVSRFDLTKRFHGDLDGSGLGLMLSAGDPQTGTAGYVAIETVQGRLDSHEGGFALQQFGTMQQGASTLQYEVVPGSGTGDLAGITGEVRLTIEANGTHRYELEYELLVE